MKTEVRNRLKVPQEPFDNTQFKAYERNPRMIKPRKDSGQSLAFALGGLGGFNAHNAGFLQAALDAAAEPSLITCTSGAIWWVYRYLTIKYDPEKYPKDQLRQELIEQAKECEGLNAIQVALCGDPGIFKPNYGDRILRALQPWPFEALNWSGGPASPAAREFFNRVCPAQQLIPERTDEDYSAIAKALTDPRSPGIMFNAYNVRSGIETVYCNEKAFRLTGLHPNSFRTRHDNRLIDRFSDADVKPLSQGGLSHPIAYAEISGTAVKHALWLVWYGIGEDHWEIDGAYHRQIILSELNACSTVFVVKPQPDKSRRAPENYFDVMDLNTEMWFNSAYAAEVAELNYWATKEGLQPADIIPVTMKGPMGFFNYFVEKPGTFDRAYQNTYSLFNQFLRIECKIH